MKYKSMISINGTNGGKMLIPALKSGEWLKRLPERTRRIWGQNNWVGYCKLLTIDYCSSDVFFIHSNRFSNHHHVVQCCTLVADGVSITPRLETKAVWRQHDCVSKKKKNPTQVHKDVAGFSELRNKTLTRGLFVGRSDWTLSKGLNPGSISPHPHGTMTATNDGNAQGPKRQQQKKRKCLLRPHVPEAPRGSTWLELGPIEDVNSTRTAQSQQTSLVSGVKVARERSGLWQTLFLWNVIKNTVAVVF